MRFKLNSFANNKINDEYLKTFKNFNDLNFDNKYLYILLPDSGPGNQIIAIKEAIIISRILNRILIIPNLHNHFLINMNAFQFKELYKLNINKNIVYYDENIFINKELHIYSCKERRFRVKLHSFKSLGNCICRERNLLDLVLFKKEHVPYLNRLNENMLILKDFFCNLVLSECGVNGCINCKLNKEFEEDYKDVCSKLDFSDNIKYLADKFISDNLKDEYISFHLRYPDSLTKDKTLSEYTQNYYNDKRFLLSIFKKYKNIKLFIATNNKFQLNKTINKIESEENLNDLFNKYKIDKSNFYKIKYKNKYKLFFKNKKSQDIFYKKDETSFIDINKKIITNNLSSKYNSWIEQYICCKSKIFIEYPVNMYSDIKKKCKCTTFSSFIRDYRLYFLHLPRDSCVNILNL